MRSGLSLFALSLVLATSSAEDAMVRFPPFMDSWEGRLQAQSAVAVGLLDALVKTGLPDPRGGRLYTGVWQEDDPRNARDRSGLVTLHIRLADGRWLMRGMFLRPAAEPTQMLRKDWKAVDEAEAHRLDGRSPFSNGQTNALLQFSWRIRGSGLGFYLRWSGLMAMNATELLRQYEGERTGWFAATPLDLPGQPWRSWEERHRDEPPSDLDAAIMPKHHLFAFLVDLMLHNGAPDAQTGLVASALSLLTEPERRVLGPSIERLAELPLEGPLKNAGPLEELQAWDGEVGFPGIRKHDLDLRSGPHFNPTHVDALIAAAGDSRPGRWAQGHVPRTIGDTALRALAWVWGADPRLIIGRDPQAPWTDEERQATVGALQRFWSPWRGKRLAHAVVSDPALLPLTWQTRLAMATPEDDQAMLGDAVAKAWSTMDTGQREALVDGAIEDVMGFLGEAPELNRLLLSWPVTGRLSRILSLWHELHGDPGPLTSHLKALLASPAVQGPSDEQDVMAALRATMLNGDQKRLEMLFTAHRSEVGSAPFRMAHQLICKARQGFRWGGESPLFDHRFEIFHGFTARMDMMRLLVGTALWDERPLKDAGCGFRTGAQMGTAADLRVCDEMVICQKDMVSHADQDTPFPASGSIGERDAFLARIRADMLARLAAIQAASGLRLPDQTGRPAVPCAFPDWWQHELDAARAEGKAVGLLLTNLKTCNPCRKLEQEVLSNPAWKAWADGHLRMFVLDGSQHDNDVEFDRRWTTLAQIYVNSGGIPNFNLILADGRNGGLHLAYEKGGPAYYIAQFTAALERAKVGGQ